MSLVHPALLYGLGLAAIPVVLHFLMRVKPRKLAFPALLLIRSRRKTNSRRLRLRHVWLLLLRVSVIVLLVVAVARPSLPAANYALSLREALTLAAIVVALLAVYRALLRYWRQARLLGNEFVWRRTLARNATGILGLLLCLMFVVWPWQQRVAAEMSGPKAELLASLPVAAVFVFDASGSMNYLFESRTRHEAAKEIAIEQLGKLPSGSRVAVTDTVPGRNVVFQADLPGARTRIQGLGVSPVAENLDRQVMSAIRFQQDDRKRILDEQGLSNESEAGDQYVREIYVLADMARSAWDLESSAHLRQDMEASPWLHVYLIDVGVPFPTNVAISGMRLSSQSIPRGSELVVDATVQITGLPPGNRSVELWLPGPDGALINRGGAEVHVDANANSRVDFTLAGLTDSLVQGELRLDPIDPFRDDDVVHFTVVLHEPAPVLLVGDSLDSTAFLHDALAPIEFEQQNRAAWNCTAITDDQLPGFDPDRFEIVCLINVSSLTDLEWDRLAGFVRNGGGLATFIGRAGGDLDAVSWASEAALAVLPAELLGAVRFSPEPAFLSVRDSAHPLFRDLTQSADEGAVFTLLECRGRARRHRTGRISGKPPPAGVA